MPATPLPATFAGATRLNLTGPALRQATILAGLLLTLAVLGVECWRYLRLGAYLDHIEGNVVIAGWLWANHGTPLYAGWAGAPRFANYYGPLAYLIPLPALWLLGPGILASKIASVVALPATLALCAWSWRRSAAMPTLHAMFLLAAGLAALSPMSFWTRPDSFETLAVAGALATATSPVCVGLCIGLAVNLKVHAFVYFLPILWQLWLRHGWRAAPAVVICSIAAFLAPFLLPGVSLHDYVAMLAQQVAGRVRIGQMLALCTAYGAALALPVLLPLCRRDITVPDRSYAIAALVALLLIFYPASFPGSGPYHFLPLLPVLAEARRRLAPTGVSAEFAVFPLLFFAAGMTQVVLPQIVQRQDWHVVAEEALALAEQAPPGSVEIGYGDNRRSYEIAQLVKTELSLHGYPRRLDAQILMELATIGIDGSRRWIADIEDCRVGRWLLPRAEQPFAVRSYFYDNVLLFDDAFREAFTANYRPVAESVHFTVWACRHDSN